MSKDGLLIHMRNFEDRRSRGDTRVNYLRDECLQTAANLRRALASHRFYAVTLPRYCLLFWSLMTLMAAASIYIRCDLDEHVTIGVFLTATTVGICLALTGFSLNMLQQGFKSYLRSRANLVADAISRARPSDRPKSDTSLAADTALTEAYDEALTEMRRAVATLGPSYLWKDPTIAEVEFALKTTR